MKSKNNNQLEGVQIPDIKKLTFVIFFVSFNKAIIHFKEHFNSTARRRILLNNIQTHFLETFYKETSLRSNFVCLILLTCIFSTSIDTSKKESLEMNVKEAWCPQKTLHFLPPPDWVLELFLTYYFHFVKNTCTYIKVVLYIYHVKKK